jgi:hypothetical protein
LWELGKRTPTFSMQGGDRVAAIRTPRKSKKKTPLVELFDPDGRLVGRARREAERMTLESDTGAEVGRLEFPHELVERQTQMRNRPLTDQAPLPVRDSLGRQVGTLELGRFSRTSSSTGARR